MTFETVLKPFALFPHFAQKGNDEPPPSGIKRGLHWVGHKDAETQPDSGGKHSGKNPQQKDSRGYRDLASITLGEVHDAHQYYADQLIPSPYPAWMAANYFCMIPLARKRTARPPAVFGRVKTCYPSDGYVQNIQELEILLPCKDRIPDIVHLSANDIHITPSKPLQSYCVRVRFLAAPEDMTDFAEHEILFTQHGFLPEFSSNYIDLLEINEHNHTALPWLYVISSRWFASIPVSVQPEIREKLTKLIHWNKLIFNYHPEHLPREVRTLNRELGMKVGYTDRYLIEPEDPSQTVQIVARAFDKIFNQALSKGI
ncbi:MAG: hypothetical protein ABI986_04715 [Chloroflexota bacterium]